MKPVFVIHGPNLNLLGRRPKEVYGAATLAEIDAEIRSLAERLGVTVEIRQTNHEGVMLDWLGGPLEGFCGIILNPGAFTHTSLALRDAVEAVGIPVVEVHLSDILSRDEIRRRSMLAGVVAGRICGFGAASYLLALHYLAGHQPRR